MECAIESRKLIAIAAANAVVWMASLCSSGQHNELFHVAWKLPEPRLKSSGRFCVQATEFAALWVLTQDGLKQDINRLRLVEFVFCA